MLRVAIILVAMTSLCLAQWQGETVGLTQYDMQEIGGGTNRIAVTSEGGIYVCWTKGMSDNEVRKVYFNYRDPGGQWLAPYEGAQVSREDEPDGLGVYLHAGFPSMDIGPGDCIIVFFHTHLYIPPPEDTLIIEIHEATTCTWPDYIVLPHADSYWPKASINQEGRINIMAGRRVLDSSDTPRIYNHSDDFGITWGDWIRIDSLTSQLWAIAASRSSPRCAMVKGEPLDTFDSPSLWDMDLFYLISEDGTNWNFDEWQPITSYENTPTRAVADVDILFDENDFLHVVWNTFEIAEPDSEFDNSSTLWHWSEETGEISQIAYFDHVTCEPGAWNMALCKMSLGVDPDDNLFCVWTGFASDDSSAGGYCNGDLYMSYSMDGGLTWADYENITNSQTPDCAPEECDSDNWATLAEMVGEYLHIFYVNDKDAGAIPQGEGLVTDNPVRYLEVPNPAMTGITESETLPDYISLLSSYPNPFNARTTIKFSLAEAAVVKLQIFDIAGRLVETLADCEFAAGENSVTWDAEDYPSSVYFARLAGNAGSVSKRLILLK